MMAGKRGVLSALAATAIFLGGAGVDTALAEKYQGSMYVAGMGGHFADATVVIEPGKETPITVTNLDKLDIGDGTTHPTHDARIDNKNRNILYWSTYKLDPEADNKTHVGKTDLKTGEVLQDTALAVPKGVLNAAKNYCASGQSEKYFFPIAMTKPGYISVINKADMSLKHQVFLEGTEADIKKPYKYMHGISSPDMKEFLVTLNESDTEGKGYGTTVGKLHLIVLDTEALGEGKVKVLRKGVITANPKSSISFRQYYSNDGKYIANATGDILFIIDAQTLEVIDAETVSPLEQLHDAIFTPDDKYVVATSRTKRVRAGVTPKNPKKPSGDEFLMDGELKLYDVSQGKFVGKSASVCLSCHDEELGTDEDAPHAVLCGLDTNWD
ncbi:YncE family protein [Desulfogranum mediterraneum]|uniref:hypothetical protein n=1 Tax=Desulfogranum mediterraneum TaxID=160661 RepID=UPI00040DDAB8|nr:hypothetical protein [Desulfogranum mediterraneum]